MSGTVLVSCPDFAKTHTMQQPCKTTMQQPCNETFGNVDDVPAEDLTFTSVLGDVSVPLVQALHMSVMDLRHPQNRFNPGDEMLWPGNIPLPSHYPFARFLGLDTWLEKSPAALYPALSLHVFHKVKPSKKDLTDFVSCHDLFEVYSVCNFEGRMAFRSFVRPIFARPAPSWPSLALPWPSNVAQGSAGEYAMIGSSAAVDIQKNLSKVGRNTFNMEVYKDSEPSPDQLENSVATAAVYEAYLHLSLVDQVVVREFFIMISPPPYVGHVAVMPYIGTVDPEPVPDPIPAPPTDPGPSDPPSDPLPPPYGGSLPEAPIGPTPPMNVPITVPVNDVPGDIPLPKTSGGLNDKHSFRLGAVHSSGATTSTTMAGAEIFQPRSSAGADQPGWCYLHLLTPAAQYEAAARLGPNPWGSQVMTYLLQSEGSWSPNRFSLTYGGSVYPTGGRAFVQAHVNPCADGIRVKEIVALLCGTTRVGMASAELDALMTLQSETQASDRPSVFDVKPATTGTKMSFGIYAKLSPENASFSWNVLGTPALALMFGIYESVRLESVDMVAILSTGADVSLWMAATENTVTLSGTDQWLSAPLNTTICGASTGVVRGKFSLPPDHQFGKEIRAATVGNRAPAFHFNHQGPAGSSSRISGTVTVIVSGSAVIGHVNIGPTPKGKSLMAPAQESATRLMSSLSYPARLKPPTLDQEDCYLESGDDDVDEEHSGGSKYGHTSPSSVHSVKR